MGILNFIKSFFINEFDSSPKCPIDISKYESVRYEAVCPACGKILESFPVRSKKCKYCKEQIIRVKLPVSESFILLNESDGLKLRGKIDRFYFEKYDQINKNDIDYVKSEKDYFSKLRDAIQRNDYYSAKMLSLNYRNLLLDEVDDNSADNPKIFQIAFNVFKYEICELSKTLSINKVVLSTGIGNCKKIELDKKKYSIQDFLKEKPIPCVDCTAVPVFSCTILPTLEE